MNLIDNINQTYQYYFLFYCLICIPLIYFLLFFSQFTIKQQSRYLFLWLYAIAVTIPFLGLILVFMVYITLYFRSKTKVIKINFKTIEYPDYQGSKHSSIVHYGEGFGFKSAKSNFAPQEVRQNILLLINKIRSSQVNKINTLLLTDELDEMRLYAQVLIEQQEKELAHKAMFIHKALNYEQDPIIIALLKKQMAEVLWEQIYRDLVNKINFKATLARIKQYALEADSVLISDCEIPIILAKAALKESELGVAKYLLEIAKKRQAPNYKIVSYLAEIAYRQKEFSKIKPLFANQFTLYMQPIAAYWSQHD